MSDVEPEYRQLGEALRRLRRERDRSQQWVADECGMSRSALANIEAGQQRVAFHQFLALARALRIDPADLLPTDPPDDRPVDEQLVHLGVPEQAARAVARVVGTVTDHADRTDSDKGGASRAAVARRPRHHQGTSTR